MKEFEEKTKKYIEEKIKEKQEDDAEMWKFMSIKYDLPNAKPTAESEKIKK